jgi:hypothetical protein
MQRFQRIWENAYLELSRRKQQQKLQEHDSKQSRANMDADENDRLIISKRKRSPSPDGIRTLWLAQYSMTVVNQTQSTSTFMSFHSTYRQIRMITPTMNKLCYNDRFFVYFNVCFSEQENYVWKKRPLAWFVVSLGPFYVVAAALEQLGLWECPIFSQIDKKWDVPNVFIFRTRTNVCSNPPHTIL